MKVLHVIYSATPAVGGPFSALGSFIEAGRSAGVESEVLSTDVHGSERREWAGEVQVRFARAWPRRGYPLAPGLLRELLRRGPEFDVLHVHGLWRFHGLAAWWASRRRGVPMIVRTCGHLSPETLSRRQWRKKAYWVLLERRVLDRARLVHFTTEAERDACLEVARLRRPVVIPPAIRLDAPPSRAEARRALGVAADARLAVFVARLDPIKGHDLLLHALRQLPDDVTLAFVGPDKDGSRARLERLAGELDVAGRLRLTGPADRATVLGWLAAADVFVTASAHENFGMSIAEAAMAGLPVVLPRGLHVARELGPGASAVERTTEGLAGGIGALLADDERRRQAGSALRERAHALWSVEAVGRRLLAAYREAAGLPGVAETS